MSTQNSSTTQTITARPASSTRPAGVNYPNAINKGNRVPAWTVSMFLHVVIIVLLALWLDRRPQGLGDQADRPVGVAVAHRMADRTVYETPEETAESEQADAREAAASAATTVAAATPPSAAQPVDVEGLLAAITQTPMPESGAGVGSALEAGNGTGDGPLQDGKGGAPPASTTFFGASGSGRRFAYVCDRSASMNGKLMDAVKKEVRRSLSLLGPTQSFQLIFYNNRPTFFDVAGFAMIPAEDSMKSRANRFVQAIEPFGSTEHYEALRLALKLRPDVIFLLTDANIPVLDERKLSEMRSRSAESGTTIHAIEFGLEPDAPSKTFLRTLANENGGEYRYLDVNKLGASERNVEN